VDVRVKKVKFQGEKAFLVHVFNINKTRQETVQINRHQRALALKQMAAGVQKELKPLLDLIRKNEAIPENEHAAERVKRISEKLSCLAKTVNDESELQSVDLNRIIQDIVEDTMLKQEKLSEEQTRGADIKTYLRIRSPVNGHPKELRSAIEALIMNAIEALPNQGEIYITSEENGGNAHVYIQDNGSGVNKGIKEDIFNPFFTTKGFQRAGLGLSLSYAIIARHGGEIEVVSHQEQGTTFIIKLPIAKRKKSAKPLNRQKRLKDPRILIVSDEEIVEDLLSRLFRSGGAKVTGVSSHVSGMNLMKKTPFDLIILDMSTPYLRIGKVIEKIKGLEPDLPVAVINTRRKSLTESDLKRMGANLVIHRPLNLDQVLAMTINVLEQHRNAS
jgi:CheY-like chemotaxis protein